MGQGPFGKPRSTATTGLAMSRHYCRRGQVGRCSHALGCGWGDPEEAMKGSSTVRGKMMFRVPAALLKEGLVAMALRDGVA